MSVHTCNINTFLLIVFVLLVVSFTDTIFKTIPVLKKLFTDSLNYILLITLVILVILIDLSSGIILSFLILYLSVYINYNNKSKFTDVKSLPNNHSAFKDTSNHTRNHTRSNSEFIYNNTKPFPNNNLKPFESITQEDIIKQSSNKQVLGCGVKVSNTSDYITQVGPPSRDSYDITGCRYDFKNSPQNLTKFGPPLSECSAYSGEQTKLCGTVFYPLNA